MTQDPMYAPHQPQVYPTWTGMETVPPSWTNVPDPMTEPEDWSPDGGAVQVGEFGFLDFLQNVVSDLTELAKYAERGELHRFPDRKPVLRPITTRTLASDDWDSRTYTLPTNQQVLVTRSPKRRCVEIVNWGPGVLFLASDTRGGNGSTPGLGEIQVPISSATFYAPRRLTTRAAIYARCSVASTVVDVMQEFDMEESDK
jgi:hypothetical protein